MLTTKRDVEKILVVSQPGLGGIVLGGVASGVAEDERFEALPAGVIELSVQERPCVGLPAIGQRPGRRAGATRKPKLGGGGIVPRAIRVIDQKAGVPLSRRLKVAQVSSGCLQGKLNGRVAGIER